MSANLNPEVCGDSAIEKADIAENSSDIRLEMKVKNNVLWRAIHKRFPSVAAMCRAIPELKTRGSEIGLLLAFKISPSKKDGEYRAICLGLERALQVPAEDLFPAELYDRFVGDETSKVVELCSFTALPSAERREILALPAPGEENNSELEAERALLRDQIRKVLRALSYREREVLKLRFGLGDGYCYSLEEIAPIFRVTRSRISQIVNTAIRKLREPSCSQELEMFLPE